MSNYDFLKPYIIPSEKESDDIKYIDFKHQFYPLEKLEVGRIKDLMGLIPYELFEFYNTIGYGFFYKDNKTYFNRLLDVFSFKDINFKEDIYEFDPDLIIYDNLYKGEKYLFFEISEGNYLAIDENDTNGKNAVYYFTKKISDSLVDFLIAFDENPDLITNLIV